MAFFVAFVFCYVNFMQCDLIAMMQHLLSDGHTTYNRYVGTVIITTVAIIVQLIMSNLFKLPNKIYALTYIPSALFLAAITDLLCNYSSEKLFGYLFVLFTTLLFCYWRSNRISRAKEENFIEIAIPNFFILTVVLLLLGLNGNTNKVLHYELKTERLIEKKEFDKALKVGEKSLETSETLTKLRAYALSRKGLLNERLYSYPVPAGMASLFPLLSDSMKMVFHPSEIFQWLGVMPDEFSTGEQYLDVISAQPELVKSHPQIIEYLLATQLLKKDIDQFARTLMKFEADSVQYDCLKKHCREAMVLYQHIRTRPVFTINDDVTEANYNDFLKLMHSNKNRKIIAPIVQSQYGDTYWWYYYFINKQVK